MKPPDNERSVLTWIRDRDGNKCWQIDSYNRPATGDPPFWFEASVWECKVLYWQELPPKPEYEEMASVWECKVLYWQELPPKPEYEEME